jgi:hypothetical protein
MAEHSSFRLTTRQPTPGVLTSKATSFYKRWFPRLWLGGVAIFLLGGISQLLKEDGFNAENAVFVIGPAAMMVFGYALCYFMLFDLVDEVRDEGDHLVVKNKGVEEQISLSNILNVSYTGLQSPNRITLTLRNPSSFGKHIAFMPELRMLPYKHHPVATDLIERIDAARNAT